MSFVKSIIDFNFYKKIYNQSFKKSLLYLLVFSLIIYAIGAYIFIVKMDRFINVQGKEIVNAMPNFSVSNGELSVENVKQPFVFKDKANVVVIDTTGSTDIEKYEMYDTVVILEKTNMKVRSDNNTQTLKYDEVMKQISITKLDKQYLVSSIPSLTKTLTKWVTIYFVIGYLFWLVFYKFISILILSLVGLIVNSVQKTNLSYKNLMNISIYAITLPWIIKLIYKVFTLNLWFNFIPLKGILLFTIYWVVATIYIIFAVKKVKNEQGSSDNNVIEQNVSEQE